MLLVDRHPAQHHHFAGDRHACEPRATRPQVASQNDIRFWRLRRTVVFCRFRDDDVHVALKQLRQAPLAYQIRRSALFSHRAVFLLVFGKNYAQHGLIAPLPQHTMVNVLANIVFIHGFVPAAYNDIVPAAGLLEPKSHFKQSAVGCLLNADLVSAVATGPIGRRERFPLFQHCESASRFHYPHHRVLFPASHCRITLSATHAADFFMGSGWLQHRIVQYFQYHRPGSGCLCRGLRRACGTHGEAETQHGLAGRDWPVVIIHAHRALSLYERD